MISVVLVNGLAFFTTPIFSRMLGTEGYGIVSVYNTWASICALCFGLQTRGTLAMAKIQYPDAQRKYQSSVLCLSIIAFLAAAGVIAVFYRPVSVMLKMDWRMIGLMLLQAFGLYCVGFATEKNIHGFQAQKNMRLSLSVAVSTVVLSLVLMQLFPAEHRYWGRVGAQSAIYGLFGLAITVSIFREGKVLVSREYWKYCLPLSVPLIVHNLATILLEQSDKIMLQWMETAQTVGIYSLAYTFATILLVIWNALNNSWLPFFYDFARKRV